MMREKSRALTSHLQQGRVMGADKVDECCTTSEPYNQVQQLEMENEKLRSIIVEQNTELLAAYRKINSLVY